jgi:hypothetical protein
VTRSSTGLNVGLTNDFELVLALSRELPDTVRPKVTDVEIAVLYRETCVKAQSVCDCASVSATTPTLPSVH